MKTSLVFILVFCSILTLGASGSSIYNNFSDFFGTLGDVSDFVSNAWSTIQNGFQSISDFFSGSNSIIQWFRDLFSL